MSRYADDIALTANIPYEVKPDKGMFVALLIINDTANIIKLGFSKEGTYASLPSSVITEIEPAREQWPIADRRKSIWIKSTIAMTVGIIKIEQESVLHPQEFDYPFVRTR